mgnify:CR=1 FL=1
MTDSEIFDLVHESVRKGVNQINRDNPIEQEAYVQALLFHSIGLAAETLGDPESVIYICVNIIQKVFDTLGWHSHIELQQVTVKTTPITFSIN